MPNNVKNILTFEGSQLAIDELFKAIEGINVGRHMDIDFNKIIPMPEDLNVKDCCMYDLAIQLFCADDDERQSIQKSKGMSDKCMEDYIKLGRVYAKNKLRYGSCTWYDWCVKNWGTKWNAYEIKRFGNTLIFETAWSAPVPIIKRISEMFPTINILHRFADEDIGQNCGYYMWRNGDITSTLKMDDEAAEEFALDVWNFGMGERT